MDPASSETAVPPPRKHLSEAELKPFPWTGLTLFLIVLALIGVAAVPRAQLSEAELAGDRTAIQAHHALQELRSAIAEYLVDHGTSPGLPPGRGASLVPGGAEELWLLRQLTLNSDASGATVPQSLASHPYGPYLSGIPVNPVNGLATVRVLGPGEELPAEPDGRSGYLYEPSTGEIRLNAPGRIFGTQAGFYDL